MAFLAQAPQLESGSAVLKLDMKSGCLGDERQDTAPEGSIQLQMWYNTMRIIHATVTGKLLGTSRTTYVCILWPFSTIWVVPCCPTADDPGMIQDKVVAQSTSPFPLAQANIQGSGGVQGQGGHMGAMHGGLLAVLKWVRKRLD